MQPPLPSLCFWANLLANGANGTEMLVLCPLCILFRSEILTAWFSGEQLRPTWAFCFIRLNSSEIEQLLYSWRFSFYIIYIYAPRMEFGDI